MRHLILLCLLIISITTQAGKTELSLPPTAINKPPTIRLIPPKLKSITDIQNNPDLSPEQKERMINFRLYRSFSQQSKVYEDQLTKLIVQYHKIHSPDMSFDDFQTKFLKAPYYVVDTTVCHLREIYNYIVEHNKVEFLAGELDKKVLSKQRQISQNTEDIQKQMEDYRRYSHYFIVGAYAKSKLSELFIDCINLLNIVIENKMLIVE